MIKVNDTEKQDIKRLYNCHVKIKKEKFINKPILGFTAKNGIVKPTYKND